jgi:type IV pilus assembly protein PilX
MKLSTQKGFILIGSLIFLVLMTLVGLAMFGGFSLDQDMAGNLREKSRAFDAAQSVVNYAENWLQTGYVNIPLACGASSPTAPQICSNAVASSTVPDAYWSSYTNLSVSTVGGSNTYASNPRYYIQYLGTGNSSNSSVYLITVSAQGGNANSSVVIQDVLQVTPQSVSMSGG